MDICATVAPATTSAKVQLTCRFEGLRESRIASDSLTVVTTSCHHCGLPFYYGARRRRGEDGISFTAGPAAIPNATATARGCGAAS